VCSLVFVIITLLGFQDRQETLKILTHQKIKAILSSVAFAINLGH
jgi:hypothetical protein